MKVHQGVATSKQGQVWRRTKSLFGMKQANRHIKKAKGRFRDCRIDSIVFLWF